MRSFATAFPVKELKYMCYIKWHACILTQMHTYTPNLIVEDFMNIVW